MSQSFTLVKKRVKLRTLWSSVHFSTSPRLSLASRHSIVHGRKAKNLNHKLPVACYSSWFFGSKKAANNSTSSVIEEKTHIIDNNKNNNTEIQNNNNNSNSNNENKNIEENNNNEDLDAVFDLKKKTKINDESLNFKQGDTVSGGSSDVPNTGGEGLKFYTENTDTETIQTLIAQKGELAAHGIGQGYWPSEFIERFLEDVHVYTGLPWWVTIVSTTFAARLLLLPMTLGTLRNAQRLRNLGPEMKMFSAQMKEYQAAKNVEALKKTQLDMLNMMQQHNVKFMSLRTMIPPGIVLMSFFFGLREMAEKGLPSLKTGGALWFTDLTVPDAYFALPAVGGALLGATLWMGYRDSKNNPNISEQQLRMQQAMMVPLGGIMLYVSIKFPAIVFLNFLPSNFCTLLINILAKVPVMQRLWNLPPPRKGNVLPWNFPPQDNGAKIITPVPKINKDTIVEAQVLNETKVKK